MFGAEIYKSKKGCWLKVTGWLPIILESMGSKTISTRVLYVEGERRIDQNRDILMEEGKC